MSSILERIYSRLLVESAPSVPPNFAAFVGEEAVRDHRNVTVYDINGFATVMRRHKTDNPDTEWDPDEMLPLLRPHVKGYMEIQKADTLGMGKCYDSWLVKFSAGPKIGELLYGLGFAITDNGKLTSDRRKVSPGAFRRWSIESGSRKGSAQFDDVSDPKTKTTYDDCTVFYDERAGILNRTYNEVGWERSTLESMQKMHYRLKNYLLHKVHGPDGEPLFTEWDIESIEVNIPYYGSEFFNSVYR